MSERERPPSIHVVGAAIVDGGSCFLARRAPTMSHPGRWEFPGGKVEEGEDPRRALVREIHEELGITIEIGRWLGRGEVMAGSRRIVLDVYEARAIAGTIQLTEHDAGGWFTPDEFDTLEFPEADRPILPALRRLLSSRERRADPETQVPPQDHST